MLDIEKFMGNIPDDEINDGVETLEMPQDSSDSLESSAEVSTGTRYLERLRGYLETTGILSKEEDAQLETAVDSRETSGFLGRILEQRRLVSSVQLITLLIPLMTSCNPSENSEIGGQIQAEYLEAKADEEARLAKDLAGIGDSESSKSSDEALRAVAEKSPTNFVKHLEGYASDKAVGDILAEIAESKSTLVLGSAEKFIDQPYAGQVLDSIISSDPSIVVDYIINDFDGADSVGKKMLQERVQTSGSEDARYLGQLLGSDLQPMEMVEVANIMVYAQDNGLSPEAALSVTKDSHQMLDALVYTAAHGSASQEQWTGALLEGAAIDIVKDINLKKGERGRFNALHGASSTELYAIAAYAGDSAIESSGNGILNSLDRQMKKDGLSSVDLVVSLNGHKVQDFMAFASTRNKLDEFIGLAGSEEGEEELMDAFLGDIEEGDTVQKIDAIARVIIFEKDAKVQELMKDKLQSEYKDAVKSGDKKAEIAYGILSGLLSEEATWLGEDASNYEVPLYDDLSVEKLVNSDGESIQIYSFYNDEDGAGSFLRTKGEYYNNPAWDIEDQGSYITISSTNTEGNKIIKYINKPEFSRFGTGEVHDAFIASGAQDGTEAIKDALAKQGKEPQIEIHRGHSYWNDKTIDRLSPNTALYLDGSCGGIATIDMALDRAPNAQFIANSGTGRGGFNDIISGHIDDSILAGTDVDWSSLEKKTEQDVMREYSDDPVNAQYLHDKYIYPNDPRASATLASMEFTKQMLAYEG